MSCLQQHTHECCFRSHNSLLLQRYGHYGHKSPIIAHIPSKKGAIQNYGCDGLVSTWGMTRRGTTSTYAKEGENSRYSAFLPW